MEFVRQWIRLSYNDPFDGFCLGLNTSFLLFLALFTGSVKESISQLKGTPENSHVSVKMVNLV